MLKNIIERLEKENPDMVCKVGFGAPMSYRGYYDQLAFEPAENVTVKSMLDYAKSAVGSTFFGYKGGEFKMGEYTDCWIAEYGSSSENMIGDMLLDYILSTGDK